METPIPRIYRVFFSSIDPLLALMGVGANIFNPRFILEGFMPKFAFPPAVETRLMLDREAGFFAGIALLQIGLLRAKPKDVTVWKYIQGNLLLVDLFQLAGFIRAFVDGGRTDVAQWRGGDWGNVIGYAALAAFRAAFLLGVGFGGKDKKPSSKS